MTSIIPQAKLLNMKLLLKLSMLLLLFGVSATAALAQYDDVYYDPERNNNRTYTERRQVQPKTTPAQTEEYTYDENYEEEEYDYYYTSRIRRFHRPYAGFNYFDPVYVDAYYYDAFARPGVAVLIYDDPFGYYGFNRMSRFNRWNGWAYGGWNRFNRMNSWNSWGNYDPYCMWNNPGLSFGFNRWNNFGMNNWNSFGFGGGFWGNSWFNTPTWGNNNFYTNNNYYINNQGNENNRNIYNGPRTGGGGVGTQPGLDNPNGRAPRFTNGPEIKSNPGTPGTVRPDFSGGRKLDEAPSYDRDRTVPGNGNPRVNTDPNRETYGTPNSTDRYRDARENLNSPSNETRRPETADPFSGGRRIDNTNGARTNTDDRQNLRPNTTQENPSYSRPRSYEPAPRSTDNSSLERSRTYTPDRSYERSRTNTDTYSAPRNNTPSNSGYSRPSYDSGRSSDFSNPSNSSAPRSIDNSGGSRSSGSSGSSSPSSSGSSSSGGRSSSSGGRQN
jgi:hypothetical protein